MDPLDLESVRQAWNSSFGLAVADAARGDDDALYVAFSVDDHSPVWWTDHLEKTAKNRGGSWSAPWKEEPWAAATPTRGGSRLIIRIPRGAQPYSPEPFIERVLWWLPRLWKRGGAWRAVAITLAPFQALWVALLWILGMTIAAAGAVLAVAVAAVGLALELAALAALALGIIFLAKALIYLVGLPAKLL